MHIGNQLSTPAVNAPLAPLHYYLPLQWASPFVLLVSSHHFIIFASTLQTPLTNAQLPPSSFHHPHRPRSTLPTSSRLPSVPPARRIFHNRWARQIIPSHHGASFIALASLFSLYISVLTAPVVLAVLASSTLTPLPAVSAAFLHTYPVRLWWCTLCVAWPYLCARTELEFHLLEKTFGMVTPARCAKKFM